MRASRASALRTSALAACMARMAWPVALSPAEKRAATSCTARARLGLDGDRGHLEEPLDLGGVARRRARRKQAQIGAKLLARRMQLVVAVDQDLERGRLRLLGERRVALGHGRLGELAVEEGLEADWP